MIKRVTTTKKKLTINSIISNKNRARKEGFTPSDNAYLSAQKDIKLGKKLGRGYFGEVYEVDNDDGNNNFVVKVPNAFVNAVACNIPKAEQKAFMHQNLDIIKDEYRNYKNLELDKQPLFIPTKARRVTVNGIHTVGLVRPKVTPIHETRAFVSESTKRKMTNSMLRDLYNKLVKLTRQGYYFEDGLQFGLDRTGKAYVFDLGEVDRCDLHSDTPYIINNKMWDRLLISLGKTQHEIDQYDIIER